MSLQKHFQPDYLLKILLIGDSGVGKSALLNRYVTNTYDEVDVSTVGVDFRVKHTQRDGKEIKLQCWDTAGQERFRSITSSYYRKVDGVIICFDVTNSESFRKVDYWLSELKKHNPAEDTYIIMLIGTKTDQSKRQVTYEEGLQRGFPYREVSPKNGTGVFEAFDLLIDMLYDKHSKMPRPEPLPIAKKSGCAC